MIQSHNHATVRSMGTQAQRGMTMVELMVAMLLGLVTTYFIAQVFAVAEGQKRTATFGSDAQVNGAVALHTIKRHLQNAGYGVVSAVEGLGCPIQGGYGTAGSTAAVPPMTLAPVVITRSTVTAEPSDTVAILASTKTEFAAPIRADQISSPGSGQMYARVKNSVGVKASDVMMTVPAVWDSTHHCTLLTVTEDTSQVATTLSKDYIPFVAGAASSFNNAPASVWNATGIQPGDWLVNFGTIRRMVFGVGSLTQTASSTVSPPDNFQVVTWTPDGKGGTEYLQSGVVLMKALYGRDTVVDANAIVDTYDTTTPVTAADWRNVLAVRVVVVARSGQREKDIVTTAEPKWNVGANVAVSYVGVPGTAPTVCAAAATACEVTLPISHLPDWQFYRYKVFETVVPLRNMLWNLGGA